ncbi:unnamed protein product [Closterium sp. NIES-54]
MRKLLRGMRLPNHQCPAAMDHAVMLHNLLSSSSLPNNASPHLLWTGKQGSTKMLRVFGCMVQYRPPAARAGRFSQRAQWGLHLGIEKNYNAWKIFDVHSKETVAARDVIFYERLMLQTYLANLQEDQDPTGGFHGNRAFASAEDEADWNEQNVDNASEEAGPLPFCSVDVPMDDDNPRESVNAETFYHFADNGYVTPVTVNTNEAERVGPNFLPDPEAGDEAAYPEDANLPRYSQTGLQILGLVTAVHGAALPKEPATVQQALGGEHREKWHEAMDKELKVLEDRNTWKVVPISMAQNKTTLTEKWVFRVKTKADGTIDKFKARWVVRGFDQEHGRDFSETFAPVSRHTSLRILLAVAAMKKKKLRIDVANAFLYAPVDAEIFVELLHSSHGEPNQVCQLLKSLYEIKQAPRLWQQYLHARLIRIGFKQLPHDQGMYRLTKDKDYILLIVYVDDLLYIGSTDSITTWFERELQRDLTLTVSSTVTQYLGLNIREEENAIFLSAEKYADTIAKRFTITPTAIYTPYRYTAGNDKGGSALLKPAGIRDYQRKLGCLLFAAVTCRPDLSYSASQLATHLKRLEAEHLAELDRALHYFVSTPTVSLIYHKNATAPPKLIETSPTLLWTGKVGDASAFRVWGSRAFVRDLSADKLSPRATPCVFLGFPPDAPGWQFYHPTSRRVLSSQDVTFDESVPYYRLFPYRTTPLPPPPLFLAPGPPPVDPLPPQGPAPSGVSQVDAVEPVEVAVDSGAATGAEPAGAGSGGTVPGGAGSGGAEPGGSESGGAEPWGPVLGGAEPGGAEPGGAEPGGAELRGAPPGGSPSASSLREPLSPQELREWFARRWRCAAGAGGSAITDGAAVAGPGGARTVRSGAAGPASSTGAGAAETTTGGPVVGDPGAVGGFGAAGGAAREGAAAGGTGAVPVVSGVAARPRPYFVPLLEQVLGSPPWTGLPPSFACPPPVQSQQEEFQCLAAASPHLVSVLLTPEGDPDALDIPTPRSYAEAIEGPYSSQWQAAMDAEMASWKSIGTYVDAVPPSGANIVSGMWIFRVKRPPGSPPVFKARYVARGFSQRQGVDYFQTFSPTPKMTTLQVLLHIAAHRDYELHSLDFSTAFLQGSLHEEIWLRRPPGFIGSFPPGTQWSLRRPVYGLRQAPREWHDTLRTTLAALGFAPSTADPSLFLRTDTSLPPFYILVYVDDLVFATADTAGLAYVKSELQKRHTCTDLGELRSYLGLQITRDRAQRTITLTQSHMVQQVLQRFGFTYSSPHATPLPTRHSLSALPSDESVESSGPYPELVGCLMYLMTCTRPDLAYPLSILARYVAPGRHRPEHMAAAKRVLRYLCSNSRMGLVLGGRSPVVLTGHADASWADDQATQRSSQGYTFSLGSGSVSWRATRSSSVLGSSCEAEIYAGAMAAQELRWLTYLLTDLGELPRSSPVLYVDNKAMLALCREQRLEHRTKQIALRYFLARELQQRGQLRLAYVASEANTADVFTKALAPCDHQCFCTQLGLVPVLPHLLTS